MARLEVVVVGAGVAGLACAVALARFENVDVTVLDQAAGVEQVGYGLHLPPNATHALRGLDLLDKVEAMGTEAHAISMLDSQSGVELLRKDVEDCREPYGAPWLFVHHDDLISVLVAEAQTLGVRFEWNSSVEDVDFETPCVQLEGGNVFAADIIIGADGVHSQIRQLMHPQAIATPNNTISYHCAVDGEMAFADTFGALTASIQSNVWLGPRASVEWLPVRRGGEFFARFTVTDGDLQGLGSDSITERLFHRFRDWDPRVGAIIALQGGLTREEHVAPLDLPSLTRDNVTLIGDAAHPCEPFLYQDTALALEDGVILGTLLGHLPRHTLPIPVALHAYTRLQHARTRRITQQSRVQGTWNHADEGAMVALRTVEFAEAACVSADMLESECPWVDGPWNMGVWMRDADGVARAEFRELVGEGR